MTAYATPAMLRVALARDPQHPEGTAAELSDDALQQSIDSAASQIDIRLGGRYPVPFSPVPPIITAIAIGIAAWLADTNYRQSVDSATQDPVNRRYNWATDLLSRLNTGTAVLPGYTSGDGFFPVNPYEGQLWGPDTFDLDTEARRRFYSDSPTGTWAGAWD